MLHWMPVFTVLAQTQQPGIGLWAVLVALILLLFIVWIVLVRVFWKGSDLRKAAPVTPSRSASIPAAAQAKSPDDLLIIEGIGPKIAGLLNAAGVTTFAQLAAMQPAQIFEIMKKGGVRIGDPTTWPEQARLAAAGDKTGLQVLQERLKGGREVSPHKK